MLHIFTVSTGLYNDLFDDNRTNSLNNLFPGYEKTFNVISDSNELTKRISTKLNSEFVYVKYFHITNLTYPFVTLHKFDYIVDMCKENNYSSDDFIVYLDATSYVIERPHEFWDNIINNHLSKYDICYGINPYGMDLLSSELDSRSKYSITLEQLTENKEDWCQASFMMGTVNGLRLLKNSINQLLLGDINYTGHWREKMCILPNFMEQHYINYVFYSLKHDLPVSNNFTILGKHYLTPAYIINQGGVAHDDSFVLCHYENGLINPKHYGSTYNENL